MNTKPVLMNMGVWYFNVSKSYFMYVILKNCICTVLSTNSDELRGLNCVLHVLSEGWCLGLCKSQICLTWGLVYSFCHHWYL